MANTAQPRRSRWADLEARIGFGRRTVRAPSGQKFRIAAHARGFVHNPTWRFPLIELVTWIWHETKYHGMWEVEVLRPMHLKLNEWAPRLLAWRSGEMGKDSAYATVAALANAIAGGSWNPDEGPPPAISTEQRPAIDDPAERDPRHNRLPPMRRRRL